MQQLRRRQHEDARGDAIAKREYAPVSRLGFPCGKVDRDVMEFKERPVVRIGRLIDSLFHSEEGSPAKRIIADPLLFARGRDEIEHLGRQRLGRFDIDADRVDRALQANGCDGDLIVMRERTDDTRRPQRLAGQAFRHGAGCISELAKEPARDDARRAARAPPIETR